MQVTESVRAKAPIGFNEQTFHVELTPEERTVGLATRRLFDSRIKRAPVWHTGRQTVVLPKNRLSPGFKARMADFIAAQEGPTITIRLDDLAKEAISPLLGSVIFTFKRIEDKLPDFSGRSADLFRNYWGINRSYHQWSTEEGQHSDAAEAILIGTGQLTQAEIETDYIDSLAQTWELPFPGDPRKMVLYAAFQEAVTGQNYAGLAARADKEDAPLTAEIIRFVSRDENFHSGGYRLFAQAFAECDQEGTARDAVDVAMNFRMPAQHLMRDQRRNSMEIVKVGAFSKQMVLDSLTKTLKGMGFVPDSMIKEVADSYWG